MPGVDVAFNHRVKLQYRESEPFRLVQTVQNQHFPNVPAPAFRPDRIACVADVPTAAHIIGVKDIKPMYCMTVFIFRNGSICLRCLRARSSLMG